MRTLEQVDRAIASAREDMHISMMNHWPITIIGEELMELYDERAQIVKAMNAEKGN